MNRASKYLVTGASGFLGVELIGRLIRDGITNIRIAGRNEGQIIKLQDKYRGLRDVCLGDLGDPFIAKLACYEVEGIFHIAAFKHVGLAETNTLQCTHSNVVGLINLLKESLVRKPEFFVFISTDKAAQINGVYGASKFLGEKLIQEISKVNPETKYITVRYGNVFGSTGSFITKWKPLMEAGKEVILTDPKATRFFWPLKDAVNFVFECLESGHSDGVPNVPKMKGISMGTVLEACQEVYGKCPVKVIGLQPGESFRETLDGKTFSDEVEQYTKEEFIREFLK